MTPRLLRVRFELKGLREFHSPSADDHIKIFVPAKGEQPAVMRDFTPRAWDLEAGTFTLDFVLHQEGPAVQWARDATVGDLLDIAGPKGSSVAPDDFDWYLLVGDATASPSIGRRLESLPLERPVSVIAFVANNEEERYVETVGNVQVTWLHATGSAERDTDLFRGTFLNRRLPPGEGFIWVAAETSIARSIYRHMIETLGHPKAWIKAAGYWSAGRSDGGKRVE